ncbi:MAG: PHP domain-containing protein, partial [Candidatus Altiarchaeales archaeon]|nr:PHP domain-containing protein [Candidatus Altiarchaeales archaeon]
MWFDIHVHTNHSDGSNSVEEVLDYANKIGLDGLVVTDHDVIEGSLKAVDLAGDLTVYPGIEVSSSDGHILGLNVSSVIPRDLSAAESVDLIHDAGGIAVAAHPYDRYR